MFQAEADKAAVLETAAMAGRRQASEAATLAAAAQRDAEETKDAYCGSTIVVVLQYDYSSTVVNLEVL